LDQMPSCAGVALGFERLAAMILGYDQLASVQALAWEDA
jgi:elongation factor P--beta-lysine ligase